MPSATISDLSSTAGIVTSSSGERRIPSTTRADGSVRKEIRVRPGYRPPEDVEVYKNRSADGWRERGKGGVPGAEPLEVEKKPVTTNAIKNAKRREARKEASVKASEDKVVAHKLADGAEAEAKGAEVVDPEVERDKEAKKLCKKLRQARDLQQKKDKGELLLPEQFKKVIRINELIRQLDKLGVDADGQKKP